MGIGAYQPTRDGQRLRQGVDAAIRQLNLKVNTIDSSAEGLVELTADEIAKDGSAAINAALRSLDGIGGCVYIPPGRHDVRQTIYMPHKTVLKGAGPSSILDFSAGQEAQLATFQACIYSQGSFRLLSQPTTTVAKNATAFTFALAHGLKAGDVINIYDAADNSFSPHRTFYRAGEWCRVVATPSATQVELDRPLYDTYLIPNANLQLRQLLPTTVAVHDLKVVGIGTTTQIAVIGVQKGAYCQFENLDLSGSQFSHLLWDRCFSMLARNVTAFDAGAAGTTNYGINISNGQRCVVTDCVMTTTRHGVTLAGFDDVGCVPNRECIVAHCVLSSTDQVALEAHGNSEYYQFLDCVCNGGLTLAGDHGRVSGCYLTNEGDVGVNRALPIVETIGLNFTLEDTDVIQTTAMGTSLGRLIDWGMNTGSSVILEDRPSVFRMHGCRVVALADGERLVGLKNQSAVHGSHATSEIRVEIDNCDFEYANTVNAEALVLIQGETATPTYFRSVRVSNCRFYGCGLSVLDASPETVAVYGNEFSKSGNYGIRVTNSGLAAAYPWGAANGRQEYSVVGNVITEAQFAGMRLQGWNDALSTVLAEANVSLNNGQGSPGATLESSIYAEDFAVAHVMGNLVGDNQVAQTQQRVFAFITITELVEGCNTMVGTFLTSTYTTVTRKLSRYWGIGAAAAQVHKELPTTGVPAAAGHTQGDLAWEEVTAAGTRVGYRHDGAAWVGFGQVGHRTGIVAPAVNANFVGETFLDTVALQWYKAVQTGTGATDWVAI